MKKIERVEVFMGSIKVGAVAQTIDGLCAFEYDSHYLNFGKSISPLELPLKNGVFIAKRQPFYGNFGVFDDCLPDGWGMLILDRYLKSKGINLHSLTLLDRLSLVGSTGRGALEFRPDRSVMNNEEYVDFTYMATETAKILKSDDYQGSSIERLYQQGGSPGGARPKVFVKFDDREWLVKFKSSSDSKSIGKTEFKYSQIAKRCGIEMPETRLFENQFFGVQRFDRTPNGKYHVVSVAGLLNADYRIPCIDYLHIFQLCQVLTHNMQEMWKVYRLMVFNFLISNKDDHAKNFAFILRDAEWQFAPAFDLLPSEGMNGYHTTSMNESLIPTKEDLFAVAEKSGLDRKNAIDIYSEMKKKVMKR